MIRFYEQFVCVFRNPSLKDDDDEKKDIKNQLKQQLQNYLIEKKIPQGDTAAFMKIKMTYSGKRHGRDDLAMVCQLCHYWARYFMNAPQYQDVWAGNNR